MNCVDIDMSNCRLLQNGDMVVDAPILDPIANAAYHQAQIEIANDPAILPAGNTEPPGQEEWTLHNTWECDAFGAQLVTTNRIDTKLAKRGMSSIVLNAKDPNCLPILNQTAPVAHRLLSTIKEWQELADPKAKSFVNIHHEFIVRDGLLDNIVENRAWRTMFKFNPGDRLRTVMQHRMSPEVFTISHSKQETLIDLRERRARETLGKLIGDRAYQQYRRRGFISVRGASGKSYVLFPGDKHSAVYENGKQVEDICVILKEKYAPTDSVIMRLVMILADEDKFRSIANISRHSAIGSLWPADLGQTLHNSLRGNDIPLPELWRKLKERAIWEPKVIEACMKFKYGSNNAETHNAAS